METRSTLRGRFLFLLLVYVLCNCLTCNAQHIFPIGASLKQNSLELPNISKEDIIIVHNGYIASYNKNYLLPDWVAYELTAEELSGGVQRKGSFKKDPYYSGLQATNNDYLRTGFDKGHMAPAADMKWSEEVMTESFYFSNICPQTPSLNRNNWLNLENLVRSAAQKYGRVWIISGSIVNINHSVIGPNKVAVPELFYKAILVISNGQYLSAAFLMKNNDDIQPITEVIMSVDDLELVINRDLFTNLPDNDTITESAVYLSDWDIN